MVTISEKSYKVHKYSRKYIKILQLKADGTSYGNHFWKVLQGAQILKKVYKNLAPEFLVLSTLDVKLHLRKRGRKLTLVKSTTLHYFPLFI